MENIWTREIGGIELSFKDLAESNTVPFVFGEFENDYYGLEQIRLSSEDTVIDIGANVGMFSIYVKKKFGCKVIAFEPVQLNFEHLKQNILLNGLSLSDFELHNTAITAIDGSIIKIGTPLINTGGSSVFYIGGDQSNCLTETLDKYITSDCAYLKIDCEGGEYDIIPTILDKLNYLKYIGIEYHQFIEDHKPSELHSLLKANFKGVIFGKLPN
jgi:FkbM family methyltransferase